MQALAGFSVALPNVLLCVVDSVLYAVLSTVLQPVLYLALYCVLVLQYMIQDSTKHSTVIYYVLKKKTIAQERISVKIAEIRSATLLLVK